MDYRGLPKCPDCSGSGWRYVDPQNRDLGVRRCPCVDLYEAMTHEEFIAHLDVVYGKKEKPPTKGIHLAKQ